MTNVKLKENERLDDLQLNDMFIIQNTQEYCFTSDAVLLANFVRANSKDIVVDLCSGSGIVGILLSQKTSAKKIYLVEMQDHFVDMQTRTIKLNNLQDKVSPIHSKVQDICNFIPRESVSVVCCNPPYKQADKHKVSDKDSVAMCKYETELSLSELLKSASDLLKFGGKFYCIHQSNRLAEILCEMKKVNLEPKVVQFIFPKISLNSNVVLIEAKKCGNVGMTVKEPMILNLESYGK